jgi:hypothetical protein
LAAGSDLPYGYGDDDRFGAVFGASQCFGGLGAYPMGGSYQQPLAANCSSESSN